MINSPFPSPSNHADPFANSNHEIAFPMEQNDFGSFSSPSPADPFTDINQELTQKPVDGSSARCNIPLNIGIPLPQDVAVKTDESSAVCRAVSSEISLLGCSQIEVHIDVSMLLVKLHLPTHLSIEKLLRAIRTRLNLTFAVLLKRGLIIDGDFIVDVNPINEARTAAIFR